MFDIKKSFSIIKDDGNYFLMQDNVPAIYLKISDEEIKSFDPKNLILKEYEGRRYYSYSVVETVWSSK